MLIFLDDSGDPGFKFDKGSSLYFVIALVIFEDELEAEKAAVKIKEYRRKIGFPDEVEFKFNKSRPEVREGFLECVKKFDFRVRCLVVPKQEIYSPELRSSKDSFYSYIIKMVLKHTDNSVVSARIRIDGSGDKIFKKNFLSYLKKQLNQTDRKIVKNCKLVDSKRDVLIQMADMIAGSIRRSYDEQKKDKDRHKKIIGEHIEDEWIFQ